MTDVSTLAYTRRPRHTATVHSEATRFYTVTSGFRPRKSRSINIRRGGGFKKETKDTLQEAALINIVAAVNENVNTEPSIKRDSNVPGSPMDSLSNTVAVLSSLMQPRDRTVSIPKTQHRMSFNLPKETIQKKPVYYKHSEDEEVAQTHPYLGVIESGVGYQMKVKQMAFGEKPVSSPMERIIKDLPFKSTMNDYSSMYDTNPKPCTTQQRDERDLVTSSPVRRLGSLKRPDSRKVHSVSRCDAIDFMDTNRQFQFRSKDPAKAVLDDSRKVIPSYAAGNVPYCRSKSLPVIFPTKSSPASTPARKTRPVIYKNRPLSRSVSKESHDSMYSRILSMPSGYGFELLSINNGVNQDPDIFSPLAHDSTKPANPRISFTGIVTQKSNWRLRSSGTSQYTGSVYSNSTVNHRRHDTMSITASSKTDLHEAVKATMIGQADSEIPLESREISSAKSKQSCLSVKSVFNDRDSDKTKSKHVKFANSPDSNVSEDSDDSDSESDRVNSRGGSSVIQTADKVVKSFSSELQPMSAQELLRFKQKIMPASVRAKDMIVKKQPYFTTSSGVKMYTVERKIAETAVKNSRDSVRSDSNNKRNEVESDEDLEPYMVTEAPIEKEIKDTSVSETSYHETANTYNEAKLTPENDNIHVETNVDEAEETRKTEREKNKVDEEDNTKQDYYKLVKAIDLHSYSGYEHKKIRKSSGGLHRKENDARKCHFVKVKLG